MRLHTVKSAHLTWPLTQTAALQSGLCCAEQDGMRQPSSLPRDLTLAVSRLLR